MRQPTVLSPPRRFLGQGVCAGCRESLLDHGPSRHYLCHLCGGAWTHTPPCSSGAHAHTFPDDSGLTSRETRSAHGRIPARRFQQGALWRGCSHALIFRLPHSLDLQVVPTAVPRLGGQAVYTTHRPGGYPPRMWYRYVSAWAFDTAGLAPARWQPCRLLLLALRSSDDASQHGALLQPPAELWTLARMNPLVLLSSRVPLTCLVCSSRCIEARDRPLHGAHVALDRCIICWPLPPVMGSPHRQVLPASLTAQG